MFGFKKESVFDTQLVGVDESNCPITGMPSRYRLTINWVNGQLSKGRESAKIAGLVMEEARKFASRIGESAAKRDSEIAALRAEISALTGTVCALRDGLGTAVRFSKNTVDLLRLIEPAALAIAHACGFGCQRRLIPELSGRFS